MALITPVKLFIVTVLFLAIRTGTSRVSQVYHITLSQNPPINAVIVSVVEQFRRSGSVLTTAKGHSGLPITV